MSSEKKCEYEILLFRHNVDLEYRTNYHRIIEISDILRVFNLSNAINFLQIRFGYLKPTSGTPGLSILLNCDLNRISQEFLQLISTGLLEIYVL